MLCCELILVLNGLQAVNCYNLFMKQQYLNYKKTGAGVMNMDHAISLSREVNLLHY